MNIHPTTVHRRIFPISPKHSLAIDRNAKILLETGSSKLGLTQGFEFPLGEKWHFPKQVEIL